MEPRNENKSSILLLHNAMIVTMDSQSRVYQDGAIAIQNNSIIAAGKSAEILPQFSSLSPQILDLSGQILLPGFINTHVHTSQQLGRGIADDVDLLTWLHDRIWPYESNMTEQDSFISTLLCGIELIHSGVTCFAEAGGQHLSGMASAVEVLGLRACLTESIMDCGEGLPASWAARTTEECIKLQEDLFMKHHNTADGRIKVWLGIRQIMNSTDRLLAETRDTAKKLETGIHMVDCLSKAGVKVSHCPAAAMRMLGFAPIREMLSAGVCVSLGTDGAPSNNRMSIVDEMYLASLVNKGREVFSKGTTDPTALPAETILRMATINGAKSVLWDKEIGSLEVGKKADIVVVNPSSWSMMPIHDCISSLVYCMRTENIVSVMCNGCWIMKDKKIITIDEEKVLSMAKHASAELLKRAGIQVPSRMNFL
ncbi:PREDICTED: uncharacterized protein LOC109243651 isoform X2 [Nicotiana attenuata]|uniref:uncharacterized protein LOC109243651 isoform X2 n=1 Tax=Nicotiana attenuata TaxID=49451 RepID=UPI0009046112|nr:PREDICTED: uncharacterized protein LOC109243651 isoform X2 [Nicotiana attenuata]